MDDESGGCLETPGWDILVLAIDLPQWERRMLGIDWIPSMAFHIFVATMIPRPHSIVRKAVIDKFILLCSKQIRCGKVLDAGQSHRQTAQSNPDSLLTVRSLSEDLPLND